MAQMIELVDTDIKTVIIITIFYMYKKIVESLSLLNRNIEDIKKEPHQISGEKQYTVWD